MKKLEKKAELMLYGEQNKTKQKHEIKQLKPGRLHTASKILFSSLTWRTEELQASCEHKLMHIQDLSSNYSLSGHC